MARALAPPLKNRIAVENLHREQGLPQKCVAAARIELSVIVPTFNERDNVSPLVERLGRALADIAWEVIFVDDNSSDGTAQVVLDLAAHNPRIRRILRVGRRGLAGAAIEGMLSSTAIYVAVMDGDL